MRDNYHFVRWLKNMDFTQKLTLDLNANGAYPVVSAK